MELFDSHLSVLKGAHLRLFVLRPAGLIKLLPTNLEKEPKVEIKT